MGLTICGAAVDWAATGAMLQGLGTILGALAVLGASLIGANTYKSWKRQQLAERRMDHAERILTATYIGRRALEGVRSVMVWRHEQTAAEDILKADPNWSSAPADRQKRLIEAQATYTRLSKTRDEQNALAACLPMARAIYGDDLEKAIKDLAHQFWLVQVDAESYIDDNGSDPVFTRKIRRGMYATKPPAGETNEISDAIAEAVSKIEQVCVPALREDY